MVSLHRTHNGHQQLLLPLGWQKCPNLSLSKALRSTPEKQPRGSRPTRGSRPRVL